MLLRLTICILPNLFQEPTSDVDEAPVSGV